MNCSEYREIASAIIDNEADENEIAQFNAHIAECEECAKWYETIKILHDGSSDLSEEVPPELKMRVMKSVTAKKKPFLSQFKFTAAAAIIIVVAYAAGGLSAKYSPDAVPQEVSTVMDEAKTAATPGMYSRSAILPDAEFKPKVESAELPHYNAKQSFVILLHGSEIPTILENTEYKEYSGHRYYKVPKEDFELFKDFDYDSLPCDPDGATHGLIIIKQ